MSWVALLGFALTRLVRFLAWPDAAGVFRFVKTQSIRRAHNVSDNNGRARAVLNSDKNNVSSRNHYQTHRCIINNEP